MKRRITRREFIRRSVQATAGGPLLWAAGCTPSLIDQPASESGRRSYRFSNAEDRFLDELEQAGFRFFWEAAHPETGLVKDRSRAEGMDERPVSSIAATGFGLTALCIGHARGFHRADEIEERVRVTLRFIWDLPQERGFLYHFINWRTGARVWNCELSSIDSAILLCGVLACRGYFEDPEIQELARKIYERVEWPWMLRTALTFSHGWKPERGFLRARWDHYSELMMLYLLALGSSTYPVPVETWHAWERPIFEYEGLRYIGAKAPLFVHQYSHAWFDFRNRTDAYADYFQNSVLATRAHKLFCLNLRAKFPYYSENLWGITASDSPRGYVAWGGPPLKGPIDGTLVPCAAAGSLPFLPQETVSTLRYMKHRFGDNVWRRYGFPDAFNPATGWFNQDVIGIDVGITTLMAENARTGFVWRIFMRNPEAQNGMKRAGFKAAVTEGGARPAHEKELSIFSFA